MNTRSERLAANEAIFRAGNEAIDANRADDDRDERPYVCECGVANCFEQVTLTREEYEAVRSYPARFLVSRGHEDRTAGEVVVEIGRRYTVVEKRGDGRRIVERSDPRAS
jgi:hypothetical protein